MVWLAAVVWTENRKSGPGHGDWAPERRENRIIPCKVSEGLDRDPTGTGRQRGAGGTGDRAEEADGADAPETAPRGCRACGRREAAGWQKEDLARLPGPGGR